MIKIRENAFWTIERGGLFGCFYKIFLDGIATANDNKKKICNLAKFYIFWNLALRFCFTNSSANMMSILPNRYREIANSGEGLGKYF